MHAGDAEQHQGPGARLRRADRQAALDLPHDPEKGEFGYDTWENDSADSTATPASGRRSRWTRTSAWSICRSKIADQRLLRRRAPRQQSLRRQPRLRRPQDRQDEVVLPDRPSSDLGLRHVLPAAAGRHQRQRQADQGRRACRPRKLPLCVRPRDRQAGLADRGEAGAAVATCRARRTRRRSRSRPSRRPMPARTSRCRRPDRLHAGTARQGARRSSKHYRWAPCSHPPVVGRLDGTARRAGIVGNASGGTNWPGGGLRSRDAHRVRAGRASGVVTLGSLQPPAGFSDIRLRIGTWPARSSASAAARASARAADAPKVSAASEAAAGLRRAAAGRTCGPPRAAAA